MKNKIKILFIAIIALYGVALEDVKAKSYSATGYLKPNTNNTGIVYQNGTDKENTYWVNKNRDKCVVDEDTNEVLQNCENEPYYDNEFQVKFNGLEDSLTGYCIDPSYGMNKSGVAMTCERVDSYRVAKSINYILNKSNSHLITQLALRFVAYDTGIAQRAVKHGRYVQSYQQSQTGLAQVSGSGLQEAYNLYIEAMNAVKQNSGSKKGENQIILKQTRTELNEDKTKYTVTYDVRTVEKENMNVQFTCDGCTIKSGADFNGMTGTLIVEIDGATAENTDCTYKIKANYESGNDNDKDIYICKASSYQQIITSLTFEQQESLGISSSAKQEFEYSIPTTAGDFYKNYCPSPNPNTCGQDKGTKFEIPKYCDKTEQTLKINGPTDIQSCVLRSTDEAGYTYQDTSSVGKNNKYCSVYCKEDYEMKMPGAKFAYSGRYFELDDTTITGTRTCYITGAATSNVEGIELDQFKEDIKAAQRALVDAYNSYAEETAIANNTGSYTQYVIGNCSNETGACSVSHKQVSVSSSIATDSSALETMKNRYINAQIDLNEILNDINECYNWDNNYCFAPLAEFDYNENYPINYQAVHKGEDGRDEKGVKLEFEETKADSTTNNEYDVNDRLNVQTVGYLGCSESGCANNINNAKISTNNQKYIKKTVKKSIQFNNTQKFETKAPHGKITKAQADSGNYLKNYSYLGAVFPVALKKTQGIYNWTLLFEKIGQKNGNTSASCGGSSYGRLNDVAKKVIGSELNSEIGYVCVYVVDIDDCPDCDVECECEDQELLDKGYTCYKKGKYDCRTIIPGPKCEDCDVYCVNCIYNGNDTYNYHTISLSNMDPNNRISNGTMGANWTNDKGKYTMTKIEESSENAYKKAEYSYTITPTQMANIRAYNNAKETYIADDVYYEKKSGYTEAINKSKFLDGDQDGCRGNNCFTEIKRNLEWKLWPEEKNGVTLNENGVGPAWK